MRFSWKKAAVIRDQIAVLVQKEFKLKYNSTALGFAWCLLVPLMMSCVYYVVFGKLMKVGRMPNYFLYLISGNFLWQFFSGVVMQNGSVLTHNSALLKKTSFDESLLIWGTFFSEGLHFLLVIPVLIGAMALYGVRPQWWSIPPNFLVAAVSVTLLAAGVSYLYSALNLVFRDLERMMRIVMQVWLYASPIFIPVRMIPEKWRFCYMLNPMASILTLWRNIFYSPRMDWSIVLPPLIVSAGIFLLGRAVFRRLQPIFAEKM